MVFSLLVDVEVTDDEDINSLLDNVLVGITDVAVVKVCSMVDITLVDITDVSSVFDTDLVNVTGTVETSALLDIRLAAKVKNDAEVCSPLDVTEEDMMDFIGVSILLGAILSLTDVTKDSPVLDISLVDCVEACSLLDVTLVAKPDAVEVSSLLVTTVTMVEAMECAEVSILLVITLALNVIDSGVDCSLLDVAVIEVRYNVVESLDSPIVVIIIGPLVEITEVCSLCDVVVLNTVLGEMTDDAIIGVLNDVKVLLLLDIILVDNKDVTLLIVDVVLSKLFTPAVLNDVVEFTLMTATAVLLCIGINDVGSVNDIVEISSLLDSAPGG